MGQSKISCEFVYHPMMHVSQVYKGFLMLQQQGIIECKIKKDFELKDTGGLNVLVNGKINVLFDCLDGIDFQPNLEKNMEAFRSRIKSADIVFKRSFHPQMAKLSLPKVYPLGLNYYVRDFSDLGSFKDNLKDRLRANFLTRKLLNLDQFRFPYQFYEQKPIVHNNKNVLFMTRLWDPYNVPLEYMKPQFEAINKARVSCIRLCKEYLGANFIGGVEDSAFARKYAPDCIMDFKFTNKVQYLSTMKNTNICIATTGLHGSIGWKFAEYVAASRCIISENLEFLPSGDFIEGKNYLGFETGDELLKQINMLQNNQQLMMDMMENNYKYYQDYVRPDKMVYNALRTVADEFSIDI